MGNDDHRRLSGYRFNRTLNQPFRFSIQRTGGLIQDQQLRFAQDRARQGDTLRLSAGQPDPAITYQRIVPIRERAYKFFGVGLPAVSISSSVASDFAHSRLSRIDRLNSTLS